MTVWSIQIACEECGLIADSIDEAPTAASATTLRRAVAKSGWTTKRDGRRWTGDYCPACSPRHNADGMTGDE